jgi:hypothetical protein
MAVINLDKGVTIKTFSPPPSGFDPSSASALDLARFGFPDRPTFAFFMRFLLCRIHDASYLYSLRSQDCQRCTRR